MKTFDIYNLNIKVATGKANSENEAVEKYCKSRNIYDKTPYSAKLKKGL